MQYPIIDNLIYAYQRNGWTGLDIPETITYEPVQLGSGDPSPDNVRPILPATTLNIGGTDIPVYGGTLDVTTGVLTVDTVSKTISSVRISYVTQLTNTTRFLILDALVSGWYNRFIKCNRLKRNDYGTDEVGFSHGDESSNVFIKLDKSLGLTTVTQVDEWLSNNPLQFVYKLATPITYQLSPAELAAAIGIENDIAHRLKLPLPHYFPHPVIDALISAADGQHTEEEKEVLRHYLTPLGIGGI